MRWKAVLAILVALLLTACAGPKLRKAAKVKPKKMSRECGVRKDIPLDEEQALCIAGLAGIKSSRPRAHRDGIFPADKARKTTAARSCMMRMPIATVP